MKFAIAVAWHNEKQIKEFLDAWGVQGYPFHLPQYLVLERDNTKAGCAVTKNRAITHALDLGAEYVVVLDDDCYPVPLQQGAAPPSLQEFAEEHIKALAPQGVRLVIPTTHPVSPRGMPYRNTDIVYPVAASMGFWLKNPDFDAITTLVGGPEQQIAYMQATIVGRYFPFSGMNYAFHRDWADCARHVNVPRFDDIWMGWVWQKVAMLKGACFNLNGPLVNHVRQSDVWKNFEEESKYLQINETIWQAIHASPLTSPEELHQQFFSNENAPAKQNAN